MRMGGEIGENILLALISSCVVLAFLNPIKLCSNGFQWGEICKYTTIQRILVLFIVHYNSC